MDHQPSSVNQIRGKHVMIRKIATAVTLSVGLVAGLAGAAGAASASTVPHIVFTWSGNGSDTASNGNASASFYVTSPVQASYTVGSCHGTGGPFFADMDNGKNGLNDDQIIASVPISNPSNTHQTVMLSPLYAGSGYHLQVVTNCSWTITLTSVAASASPVRLYGNNGWYSSSVKPSSFSLGQGGSPGVGGMRWSHWTTTAYGTGTLYLDNCVPNCAIGHESKYPISVTLQHAKMHGSTRYFATMEWRWYAGGHLHTWWFTFGIYYAGATQPTWKPI
jgi:hypothetical protein